MTRARPIAAYLNDVTCVTAADCWAFGQDSAQHAVAEHWNGNAWPVGAERRASQK